MTTKLEKSIDEQITEIENLGNDLWSMPLLELENVPRDLIAMCAVLRNLIFGKKAKPEKP